MFFDADTTSSLDAPILLSMSTHAINPGAYAEMPTYSSTSATLGFFVPCLRETVRQLNRLTALPENWNSYGADPITGASVRVACQLLLDVQNALLELLGEQIRPDNVAPLDDGGVQMEWEGTRGEIEVEIGGNGSLGYLLIERFGGERHFMEASDVGTREVVERIGGVLGLRSALPLVA